MYFWLWCIWKCSKNSLSLSHCPSIELVQNSSSHLQELLLYLLVFCMSGKTVHDHYIIIQIMQLTYLHQVSWHHYVIMPIKQWHDGISHYFELSWFLKDAIASQFSFVFAVRQMHSNIQVKTWMFVCVPAQANCFTSLLYGITVRRSFIIAVLKTACGISAGFPPPPPRWVKLAHLKRIVGSSSSYFCVFVD